MLIDVKDAWMMYIQDRKYLRIMVITKHDNMTHSFALVPFKSIFRHKDSFESEDVINTTTS